MTKKEMKLLSSFARRIYGPIETTSDIVGLVFAVGVALLPFITVVLILY